MQHVFDAERELIGAAQRRPDHAPGGAGAPGRRCPSSRAARRTGTPRRRCARPSATISRISSSVCSMMPLPWLMRWMVTSCAAALCDAPPRIARGPSDDGISIAVLAAVGEPLRRGGQIVGVARRQAGAGQKVGGFTHRMSSSWQTGSASVDARSTLRSWRRARSDLDGASGSDRRAFDQWRRQLADFRGPCRRSRLRMAASALRRLARGDRAEHGAMLRQGRGARLPGSRLRRAEAARRTPCRQTRVICSSNSLPHARRMVRWKRMSASTNARRSPPSSGLPPAPRPCPSIRRHQRRDAPRHPRARRQTPPPAAR